MEQIDADFSPKLPLKHEDGEQHGDLACNQSLRLLRTGDVCKTPGSLDKTAAQTGVHPHADAGRRKLELV